MFIQKLDTKGTYSELRMRNYQYIKWLNANTDYAQFIGPYKDNFPSAVVLKDKDVEAFRKVFSK